jgi:iron complex transport system ATP-binding protein
LIFSLRGVGMRYGESTVLQEIRLDLAEPQFVSIAGPNGAGKSTLLEIMAGLREGYTGSCMLYDREVRSWPRREFAREVSVVLQSVRVGCRSPTRCSNRTTTSQQ